MALIPFKSFEDYMKQYLSEHYRGKIKRKTVFEWKMPGAMAGNELRPWKDKPEEYYTRYYGIPSRSGKMIYVRIKYRGQECLSRDEDIVAAFKQARETP